MLGLSRGSLTALLLASAALATPSTVELLSTRQTSNCPSSYTSHNGLNFTTYCGKNNPGNDAIEKFSAKTMQECLEKCSRFWGQGEGCFGVAWRISDQQCWLRNSTATDSTLIDDADLNSALVDRDQMKALNTDCPASDLSTHDLEGVQGIGYTVHCGKVIGNYDACFEGYQGCYPNTAFTGYWHAESLEECLQHCVNEHPLCRAVSYNPGLEIGYANCWPKTGFGNTLDDPTSGMGILHSATITSLDTPDSKCPTSDKYTTTGNKAFEIHCGQVNAGTNITSTHAQNITSCIDTCGSSNQSCIGVVFDSTLQSGWNNCYLKNTSSVVTNQESATYALLSGTVLPTSSPSSSPPASSPISSGSGSKAWIAGAVIGGVAGLALIGGAVWFFKRRQAKNAGGFGYGGERKRYEADDTSYAPAQAPLSEMGDGQEVVEADSRETVKYAHVKPKQQGPAELPS